MWSIDYQRSRLREYLEKFPHLKGQTYLSGSGSHAFCLSSSEPANLFLYTEYLCAHLLCEEKGTSPCLVCEGCQAFRMKNPLRYYPVFPRGQILGIDQVREIHHQCSHSLEPGQKQVIPIFFPGSMNLEASNAFLKGLEEPGPGRIFLLVNPFSKFLIPTISSRLNHVNLPSARSLYDTDESEEFFLARITDFPISGNTDCARSVLKDSRDLSDFYKSWVNRLKDLPAEKALDQLLLEHLTSQECIAGRRLGVLHFLEGISTRELPFLDREIEKLRKALDDLQDMVITRGAEHRRKNSEELGEHFEHWLLKDMKKPELQAFFRGILYREIEIIFLEILRLVENLLVGQVDFEVLSQEKMVGLNFSYLQKPGALFKLGQKVVEAHRMLYNNVPWHSLLEELAIHLIQNRESE